MRTFRTLAVTGLLWRVGFGITIALNSAEAQ
jgi:hypothetical protein